MPTVFVRFAGCNLKCPLWPCDTPHAIDPKIFQKEQRILGAEDVCREILETAPQGVFNVCFTGGEPFLQHRGELDDLIGMLTEENRVDEIECFSNGTLLWTPLARQWVSFVMDWKLPGSGEWKKGEDDRIMNFGGMDEFDCVKFTIADEHDYHAARGIWENRKNFNDLPDWYYGAVWDKLDNAELISWVLRDGLPWRFTMQVHNYVWDRKTRGI